MGISKASQKNMTNSVRSGQLGDNRYSISFDLQLEDTEQCGAGAELIPSMETTSLHEEAH